MSDGAAERDDMADEQAYLDQAYASLDAMRDSAAKVAGSYADVGVGGTHQARLEREAAELVTRRRLSALRIGNLPLCFGRIDLQDDAQNLAIGGSYYVGRVAVTDHEQTPLIVDWRAPIAEPFYRSTPIEPMDVVRRRHFLCSGRTIVGIDDEIFDQDAAEAAGLSVVGEGALLQALNRERTGKMGDIVATIQSEQDEIIRGALEGVLIVTGGPGTGKTAVALHRAAYLLYTHRKKLANSGVLLVGPSPVFLHYIDEVLPALGEDEVQLATVRALKPQLKLTGTESDETAALKGDARMATVLARALRDRQHALRNDIVFELNGITLRIRRSDSRHLIERAQKKRGYHNEKRPAVVKSLVDQLVHQYEKGLAAQYSRGSQRLGEYPRNVHPINTDEIGPVMDDPEVAAMLARGEHAPAEWRMELANRIRRHGAMREALERIWPVLSGAQLVHDLFSFAALVKSAANGVLSAHEQALLVRPRAASIDAVPWTEGDVGLVDEADALCGPVSMAKPRRRKRRRGGAEDAAASTLRELGLSEYVSAADLAARYGENGDGEGGHEELRTFGHVLVDEAQDLTSMQWRMLARRGPAGSMTLVGDFGQASRPGACQNWDEVLAQLPERYPPRLGALTVNYRTPAEIMDLAHQVLAVAAPWVPATDSVRHTGQFPTFEAVDRDTLVAAAERATREARTRKGKVAVLAPGHLRGAIIAALSDLGAVGESIDALDAPVAVLDATDSKGLEFDHVILVEPSRLVNPDSAGLKLLFVALTRATQTLAIVHAEALPPGLAHPVGV